MPANNNFLTRRRFLQTGGSALAASSFAAFPSLLAQSPGERPERATTVNVLNPRGRVPVGMIIDDSTCLVNLNRFAMPQFDAAWQGQNKTYHRNWKEWSPEIPDRFVRKFGEWCADNGVKGKYSIVPYPACVGRLDREVPGWTRRELEDSIRLVREVMMPHWDIHPEMVTHTRIIDLKTGHPVPEFSLKFMENWEWTTGRSADEIAAYMSYALEILKNIGLTCEGITTPGGFGGRALPQLARASMEAVREVFGAEIPHYFRHAYSEGPQSVAPRVEYAGGLEGADPRCVVSVIACTGDWTGGWDNTEPAGADKFITADGRGGRMVEIIRRGEPAMMLAHWTGFHWEGRELGFDVFKEVVRRLREHHHERIHWMKLTELSRYWAAKELTRIRHTGDGIAFQAPFACPEFTVEISGQTERVPSLITAESRTALKEAGNLAALRPGTWHQAGEKTVVCLALPRGASRIEFA